MPQWLGFALAITGPIFLWFAAGVLLRRAGWVSDSLIERVSLLVFRYAMPTVLLIGASRVDYGHLAESRYLLAGGVSTVAVTVLAGLYGRLRNMARGEQGIFVQAAFRANLGIIGIALCASAYGDEGLALAALPVAVLTILYNILAVYVLNRAHGRGNSPGAMLASLLSNPLIIGIGLGVMISLLQIPVPALAYRFGSAFSALVLPIALITIGASLSLKTLRESSTLTLEACAWRLLIAPLLLICVAVPMGVSGIELGVIFLLLGAPVANASFVMVVAVGGDGPLSANIVLLTTLAATLSLTVGLAVLRYLQLV